MTIAVAVGAAGISLFAVFESYAAPTALAHTAACACDRAWQSVYSRTSPAFNDKEKDARAHARLFEELAKKNPGMTRRAIIAQGKYSDVANLPFLYGFTNDVEYAGLAANAIVRVLGVTSNSLEIADHVMGMERVSSHEKYHICTAVAAMAKWDGTPEEGRQLAVSALRRYASIVPESSAMASEVEHAVADVSVRHVEEKNAEARPMTHEAIKAAFLSATAPICDHDAYQRRYQRAVALCNGDNALFSRIAKEIAAEHPDRIPWAMCVLAGHGSANDVPFLAGYTNDVEHAAMAAASIVAIEGVTSNSIAIADSVMNMKLEDNHDRYVICSAITHRAKADGADPASRRLAVSTLMEYARSIPMTAFWADGFLLSLDPAYETSEGRKALLREVAARRVNDYQVDYATNALKKIDAKVTEEKRED